MAKYPDWFRESPLYGAKEDPLEKSLDALANVAGRFFSQKDKQIQDYKEESIRSKRFEERFRLNDVQHWREKHPDIDIVGNPASNEDDYQAYKARVKEKEDSKNKGAKYKPKGGVISQRAQDEIFTYGPDAVSLDITPAVVSIEDLINFDAYILGDESSEGSDIAKRHNWDGLLSDSAIDDSLVDAGDAWLLDTSDINDLLDKGIITDDIVLTAKKEWDSYAAGVPGDYYLLNRTSRDQIVRRYEYWKEAFVDKNELKNVSELTNDIVEKNQAILKKEKELISSGTPEGEVYKQYINKAWNHFIQPDEGFVDAEGDYWTTDYVTEEAWNSYGACMMTGVGDCNQILQAPGSKEKLSKKHKDFVEEFPEVYNFLTLNMSHEDALNDYVNNPALQEELLKIPQLNNTISKVFLDLATVEHEKKVLGIQDKQLPYIQEEAVIGIGRDIVLNDLQTSDLGSGILFDVSEFKSLPIDKKREYGKKLMELESSYANPNSPNYDPRVSAFLSFYGYGDLEPGKAILALIEELRISGLDLRKRNK